MENTLRKTMNRIFKRFRKQISLTAGPVQRESEMGRCKLPYMTWHVLDDYCILHFIFLHEQVDMITKWSRPVLVPEPDEPVEHCHVGEDLPGEHLQLSHALRLPSRHSWVELCFKLFLSTEPYPSFTFVLHVDSFNTLKEKKRKVFVYIEIYFPVFILRGVEISTLVPSHQDTSVYELLCLTKFLQDEDLLLRLKI